MVQSIAFEFQPFSDDEDDVAMTTARRLTVSLNFLFTVMMYGMHGDLLRIEDIAASFTWSDYETSMQRWMGTRRSGFPLSRGGWATPLPASVYLLSSGSSAVHYNTARTVSVHSARKKSYLVSSLLSWSARRSAALYKKEEDLLQLSRAESEEDDFPSSCLVGWQAPKLLL